MRRSLALCIVLASVPALAETPVDALLGACAKAGDAERRIECLELAVRGLAAQPASEGAKTRDVVAQSPQDFKVADAEDLFVSPNKFKGRGVELRGMACFHADQDDYRCIARGGATLVIFAKTVTPPDARSKLEDECGQIKKASTPICRRNIRFVADQFDTDTVSGYQNRVIFRPSSIEVVGSQPARKRR